MNSRHEDGVDAGVILIVDDEPANLELLTGLLANDYEVLAAIDGPSALELLGRVRVDLVLLDVMMPGMDGYEVCRLIKANEEIAGVPVMFITSLDDDQAEAHALEVGAVDYITKPLRASIVRRRVHNHMELKQLHDRLTRLANTDGLTGLANRRRFDQALGLECRRLRRCAAGRLSLILLDIDHFKRFNDSYGHCVGDLCLKGVGAVIAGLVRRANDLAARYGGEEFVCILPETDAAGAAALAERLREAIADLTLRDGESTIPYRLTASMGVVSVASVLEVTPEQLLEAADIQLYRAKAAGRNRVVATVLAGDPAIPLCPTQPGS
jgi:diguanylate cyclase (GGDEF)-like protein